MTRRNSDYCTQREEFNFSFILITFIGTLGFSIVLPLLVFLVIDLDGNAIVYGILSATYPAFQLIGAPILGRWSYIYGRRKILLLSHGGTLAVVPSRSSTFCFLL
jgi:MFS transporter, DHA1 family, tetracycline resistance protein